MVKKSEFIWNSIASIVASMLSVLLLLFVTRINGSDSAGLFAITFATATILNAVGDFGMRIFQVTDTNRKYTFDDYLFARLIVAVLMIFATICFCLISGYELEKSILCLVIVAYRFVEVISETYQGEFQLHQRLEIAAKSVVFRTVGAIVTFCILDLFTQNVILSAIGMVVWAVIVYLYYDNRLIKLYTSLTYAFHISQVKSLIIACFPTFFSTLLNLYIINAPKYAIDSILTYQDQTIFNIIFLPTFTINLLSIFVLKPMLLGLGVMWNERNYKKFKSIIIKMMGLITVLTILVEIVSYFIGLPILSLLYGLDLSAYKLDFLILIISGGLSALSVMLFYALTTMRCQKLVSLPYVITTLCAMILCNYLVEEMGIHGAAISSALITLILFIISLIIVVISFLKKKRS